MRYDKADPSEVFLKRRVYIIKRRLKDSSREGYVIGSGGVICIHCKGCLLYTSTSKTNSLPNQLSGGQQQRVAIARALATKPAIILADEPTGNLDSKTSLDVLGLLKVTSDKFKQTIVMITHNEEIAQTADRIIRIEDGRIAGDRNA